jgi:tetratricopeptide (TPR) repeat protein
MNTDKATPLVLTMTVLIAAANVLRPLERLADEWPKRSEMRADQLAIAAGHGGTLALLGGMRSVVAGGSWLQANLAWERRDPAATTALIELTVAADERPLYFWLNGARMLACDLPEWRLAGFAPAAVRDRVNEEQARQALQFLEKGLRWRGPDPALYIEMANIHLRRRGDVESAARCYRLAAELPAAPYYAARIHAELLHELGQQQGALDWLRRILPTLPADDPLARREVVLERIKALEQELAARSSDMHLRSHSPNISEPQRH